MQTTEYRMKHLLLRGIVVALVQHEPGDLGIVMMYMVVFDAHKKPPHHVGNLSAHKRQARWSCGILHVSDGRYEPPTVPTYLPTYLLVPIRVRIRIHTTQRQYELRTLVANTPLPTTRPSIHEPTPRPTDLDERAAKECGVGEGPVLGTPGVSVCGSIRRWNRWW